LFICDYLCDLWVAIGWLGGKFEIRNSKFEIRNFPNSDRLSQSGIDLYGMVPDGSDRSLAPLLLYSPLGRLLTRVSRAAGQQYTFPTRIETGGSIVVGTDGISQANGRNKRTGTG